MIYSILNIQGHDDSFSLRRGVLLYWAMGCPGEMGRFSCCGFFSPNNHDMWYAAFPNQCQGPVLVDRQHECWNAVACHLYLLAQRSPFICPHFNSPAPLYYLSPLQLPSPPLLSVSLETPQPPSIICLRLPAQRAEKALSTWEGPPLGRLGRVGSAGSAKILSKT